MKQVGLYISQLYFRMRKSRLNNKKKYLDTINGNLIVDKK